ncbi:MAG: putative anti-sigma factor [Sedimentibacter sp.]|jgi:serine/threonine-protein kinase RsbW|nr:putative anti-sigma factor [Sedimentibacter sp.]
MDYRFEKKVQSDIKGVKNIVEEILQNIVDIINENIFFNTKIILYELVINGVLHGNCQDINKSLSIKVMINNSCIIIEVTDEGTGIIYKHKSFGDYDFCESGRGLMLVEGLSDKFTVDGNRVTCIQYLK